jgi:hypothetical protein
VVHQADARLALERTTLDVQLFRGKPREPVLVFILGGARITNAAALTAAGERTERNGNGSEDHDLAENHRARLREEEDEQHAEQTQTRGAPSKRET